MYLTISCDHLGSLLTNIIEQIFSQYFFFFIIVFDIFWNLFPLFVLHLFRCPYEFSIFHIHKQSLSVHQSLGVLTFMMFEFISLSVCTSVVCQCFFFLLFSLFSFPGAKKKKKELFREHKKITSFFLLFFRSFDDLSIILHTIVRP